MSSFLSVSCVQTLNTPLICLSARVSLNRKLPHQRLGSAEHLRQHHYNVPTGPEPLGRTPLSVRLYESDHETIKAMGKAGGLFVREVVRKALLQQAQQQQ